MMWGGKLNFKELNPLAALASRDLAALDFCGNTLKLVLVRPYPNKREVVNIITRDINGLSDEGISKIIRDAFVTLNARNPQVINTVSAHLAITKNIEVPSTETREIKEIVNLQAGRHTPYSREEIIVDYANIGTYKKNYTKILLVIVARNIIKKQFTILDRAGIKPEKFIFAPEGLAVSIARILKLESQNSPFNLIHVDETSTDFMVILKDKLIFIRSIPIGARHLGEEGEKHRLKFAEEVKGSLETYQGENIESGPTMAVLTGAVEDIDGLETLLSYSLHLPVKTMPYFRHLFLTEEAARLSPAFKRISFLNVIAPLATLSETRVDLIPEEAKLRKTLEEKGKDLITTGIFVLTVFVLISSILVNKIYFKSSFLTNLQAKYQPVTQEAGQLEKEFARIVLVNNYLSNHGYSLEVLGELYAITPEGMEFNDIRYDSQGKFSLGGSAESMSAVFSFVDKMEKSKYFKDVKTKYTTKRKDGQRDVVDFEIGASLERLMDG